MTATVTERLRLRAERLRQIFHPVDAEIIEAGNQLVDVSGAFGEISATFEALPKALGGDIIAAASGRLAEVAAELTSLADALVREREHLLLLGQEHARLGQRIREVDGRVRAISTLAVNARILAAGISSGTEDITGFTREMLALVRLSEAAVERYRDAHGRVAALLRNVGGTQAAFERQQGALLRSVARQIELSLQGLAERRTQAREAAVVIEARARKVTAELGAVVVALQVGDITRQRLEHVVEVLDGLVLGLQAPEAEAAEAGWAGGLSPAEREAVTAAACGMQASQLRHAADDFAGELARIAAALSQLGSEAHALGRIGSEVYGQGDRARGSFLSALERNLADAATLIGDCLRLRGDVDQAVIEITELLRRLQQDLNTVRDIEMDMRLVGLNATFKCARLGPDGQSLNVVSQELRSCANQTVLAADALIAGLAGTLEVAQQLDENSRAVRVDNLEALLASLSQSLAAFRDAGNGVDEALALFGRHAEAVGPALGRMASGLPLASALAEGLRNEALELEALAQDADGKGIEAGLLASRLGQLGAGRYTMASERQVHAGFLGIEGDEAEAPAPAAAVDDIESIFF